MMLIKLAVQGEHYDTPETFQPYFCQVILKNPDKPDVVFQLREEVEGSLQIHSPTGTIAIEPEVSNNIRIREGRRL